MILRYRKGIIGVSRGGLPAAVEISNRLEVRMFCIGVSSYKGEDREEIEIYQWLPEDLDIRFNNILIVEDLNDTGNTLSFICNKLLDLDPKSITLFLLQNNIKEEKVEIDSRVNQIICNDVEDNWIVYDWEVEDLSTINLMIDF